MARLIRTCVLISILPIAFAVAADAPGVGPGRTRPLPDTMAAQHRLQIRKTSRWIQDDETSAALEAEKLKVLGKKRRLLIKELEKTLKTVKEEPRKLDLSLRLGRLYMEEYYASMNSAFEKYEQALEKYQKNPKGKKAPRLSRSRATAQLNNARSIFKSLKAKHATGKRGDEILYFFALTSLDKGMEKAAMEAFQQLVDKNPRSRFTPDALAQLGDFYFREHDVEKAESYFDKIVKRKLAPLVSYALYKKAWCAYHQEKPEAALKLFAKVIEDEKPGKADVGVRVRNEALADITLLFTELNLVERSISYFRGFEDPIYRRGLETMAALYLEKGKHQSSIDLWENLIQSDILHPKNPSYEANVAEALVLKSDVEGAIARLGRRIPLYLDDSDWHDKNGKTEGVTQAGLTLLEELVRRYALKFHDTAQKMTQGKYYDYAKSLYARHLELFPKAAESNRMRYNLAKIHFKQGEFRDAANQYATVHEKEPKGALKKDALVQALASLSKELGARPAENVAPRGKGTEKLGDDEEGERVAYGEAEEQFLALSQTYLKEYPDAKDVAEVLYERGYLLYRHRDFDKALAVFKEIVGRNPKHVTATSAAHLSLDIFNRRKDYAGLVTVCEGLLTVDFDNLKFRGEVEEILRRSELKLIEILEKEEKFAQAAEGYLRYCDKYGPQDPALHEKALHNAAVQFTKAERYVSAQETMEKFLRTFPKSKLTPQTRLLVARSHESMGEPARAARFYAEYAQNTPKGRETKTAIQLAGWNYWAAGDLARAEKWLETYLDLYPTDPSAERNLLSFYESQGFEDQVAKFHRRARGRKGIGPIELADRTVKLAELVVKQSPKEAGKLLAEAAEIAHGFEGHFKKHAKGVEILSKIALWKLQEKESGYYRVRLNRSATLEANLAKKMELLKELERDYSRVSALGNEEMGLSAIYKTARAYAHMAQEAANAPVPPSLSGKDLEAYQREIKDVMVTPFQEKTVALSQRCLEDSQELHLYSKWTAKCFSLAAEVNAEKYPTVRTFYVASLHTAVFAPDPKKSKIPAGAESAEVRFPSLASSLLDGFSSEAQALYFGADDPEDLSASSHDPLSFDYSLLADNRGEVVERALSSESPGRGDTPTFAYLNLLRLKKPSEGVSAIREALRIDPLNPALHNLLGVAYLESGNLAGAETTWLAMIGRGEKNGAVLNNLGVLNLVRGKETQAIAFFNDAKALEDGNEAPINLGFLALKYRNGGLGRDLFEDVRKRGESGPADVGVLVAQMQAGDMDDLRENLEDLTKRHQTDPYARLAVAYFLIDVERDFSLASKVLNEYLERGEMKEPGGHFQRALREAARGMNEEVASLQLDRKE